MSLAATEKLSSTAAASKTLCSIGSRSRMSPANWLLRDRSRHRKTCSGKSKNPDEQLWRLKMGRRLLSSVRVAATGCAGSRRYGTEAAALVGSRVLLWQQDSHPK